MPAAATPNACRLRSPGRKRNIVESQDRFSTRTKTHGRVAGQPRNQHPAESRAVYGLDHCRVDRKRNAWNSRGRSSKRRERNLHSQQEFPGPPEKASPGPQIIPSTRATAQSAFTKPPSFTPRCGIDLRSRSNMKIPIKEITVANRFIYYYANFKERFYGYVLRRDGRNIPDAHYAGRFKESGVSTRSQPGKVSSRPITRRRWRELRPPLPPEGRETLADPEPGEIVLFLYRKRLMLGAFSHRVWGTRICIAAEDGRRLVIRRNSPGLPLPASALRTNPDFLRSYGASVRALARHIDPPGNLERVQGRPTRY